MGDKVRDARLTGIEDCLLRAISGDLGARAEVSDALDEVDGIATGVNILIAELQHRLNELKAASLRAQASVQAKRQFLRNMSHEIRTPMNGVVGMLSLLEEAGLKPEQQEYMTAIGRSSRALIRLLDDILDFSKIESKVLTIEAAPFSLYDIVDDVAVLLGEGGQRRGIGLVVYFDCSLDKIHTLDGGRVRQVLWNIAANALKFTKEGSVAIHVELADEGEHYQDVLIEVFDTGIGIAQHELKSLFESFYQGDATSSREFGGSGLGLAISKELVELMGGAIGVESELGQGSRFWFQLRLPRSAAGGESDVSFGDGNVGGRVAVVSGRGLVRQTLAKQLKSWGIGIDLHSALTPKVLADPGGSAVFLDIGDPSVAQALRTGAFNSLDASQSRFVCLIGDDDALRSRDLLSPAHCARLRFPVRPRELYRLLEPCTTTGSNREGGTGPSASSIPSLGLRVLVAEDNPDNQLLMRRILRRLGCRVEVESDGQGALEAWKRAPFDIVLMDCQMPRMDGFEASQRLRSLSGGAAVPIVAVSAGASEVDKARSKKCGMNDYLTKPVTLDSVGDVLRRWMGQE